MALPQAEPRSSRNEALARARFNKGLTQKQLAAQAGLSERTIQNLEAGAKPEPPTARVVADALDVAIEDVFTYGTAA